MSNFSLQYEYSNAGFVRALPKIQRALYARSSWTQFAIAAIVGFVVVMIASMLRSEPRPLLLAICAAVGVAAVVAIVLIVRSGRAAVVRRMDALQPALPVRIEADDQGLEIADAHSRLWWDWRYIHGTVDVPDGMAVLVGATGIFIPDAAFASPSERQDFVAHVGARSTTAAS